jgi:outer membrane biogenesis lipoprotein LolB
VGGVKWSLSKFLIGGINMKRYFIFISLLVTILLNGCGGGSSDSTNTTDDNTTTDKLTVKSVEIK